MLGQKKIVREGFLYNVTSQLKLGQNVEVGSKVEFKYDMHYKRKR